MPSRPTGNDSATGVLAASKCYLLDTNILSNATKPVPPPSLVAWMAAQFDEDLFIASFTVAEIRRGVVDLPKGRRRDQLETWFSGPEGPQALFASRVLPFDEKVALVWATLMADGKTTGRPRNALDTLIAAVAVANGCTVVTDNEKDYSGLPAINPVR